MTGPAAGQLHQAWSYQAAASAFAAAVWQSGLVSSAVLPAAPRNPHPAGGEAAERAVVALASVGRGPGGTRRRPRGFLDRVERPPHRGFPQAGVGGVAEPELAGAARGAGDGGEPGLRRAARQGSGTGRGPSPISARSSRSGSGRRRGSWRRSQCPGARPRRRRSRRRTRRAGSFSSCSSRVKDLRGERLAGDRAR